MGKYFPKPKSLGTNVKVELDLFNYATKTKSDLKNATGVDTSDFVKKNDLADLESDIDKLKKVPTSLNNLKSKVDVHKLVTAPVDLSKLSDVVIARNYVVKKDVYNAKIKDIEDEIPDITNLATNTNLNAKINGVKNEIFSIINF